jgi:hypothetical protein
MEDNESSPKYELTPLDHEAHPKGDTKRGGWITLPFIAGYMISDLSINSPPEETKTCANACLV